MKVLVYGHKGWIGQQFITLLREKVETNYNYDYEFFESTGLLD